jgi:hypothetical protein
VLEVVDSSTIAIETLNFWDSEYARAAAAIAVASARLRPNLVCMLLVLWWV